MLTRARARRSWRSGRRAGVEQRGPAQPHAHQRHRPAQALGRPTHRGARAHRRRGPSRPLAPSRDARARGRRRRRRRAGRRGGEGAVRQRRRVPRGAGRGDAAGLAALRRGAAAPGGEEGQLPRVTPRACARALPFLCDGDACCAHRAQGLAAHLALHVRARVACGAGMRAQGPGGAGAAGAGAAAAERAAGAQLRARGGRHLPQPAVPAALPVVRQRRPRARHRTPPPPRRARSWFVADAGRVGSRRCLFV
eukprot:scaffold2789_cov297-Prasinococcus_capsulatus_cf.AAC.5